MLGLEFICSEFRLKGLRIDTLAFDNDSNSFVILEYKKDENGSLVDQGFAYLSLVLRNKASIALRYNKCVKERKRSSDINWNSSRVIFVSPSYSAYQENLACFNDLPVELYRIRKYGREIIFFEKVKPAESLPLTRPPVKRKSKKSSVKRVKAGYTESRQGCSVENGLLGCME